MTTNIARSSAELLRLAVEAEGSPDLLIRALDILLAELQCASGVLADVTWIRGASVQMQLLAQSQASEAAPRAVDPPSLRSQVDLPVVALAPEDGGYVLRELPAELVLDAVPSCARRFQAFLFGHPDTGMLLLLLETGSEHRHMPGESRLLFLSLQALVRQWQDTQLRESAEVMLEQAFTEEDPSGSALLDLFNHLEQGVACIDIHGYIVHISRPALRLLGMHDVTLPPQTHFGSVLARTGRLVDLQAARLPPALRWIFRQRTEPSVDHIPDRFALSLPAGNALQIRHVTLRQGLHALILSELGHAEDGGGADGHADWFQIQMIDQTRLADESRRQTEQLLATVARQFLDPIRTLQQSATRLLREPAPARPALIEQLTRIDHTATRLSHLVSDVVDYHLVARARVRPETLDLVPLLEMTVKEVFAQLAGDALTASRAPLVSADPTLLIRAFAHLIQFSWDLRKPEEPLRLRLGFSRHQQAFVLSDNGKGMDMTLLQQLVNTPLLDAPPADDEIHRSGRSLAVVRKIFDLQGGAFEVIAIPGVGTTYYFQLPLVGAMQEAPNA